VVSILATMMSENKILLLEKMATKEGPVLQQVELSSLNLPQLMQLKQQLDQVFI